MREPRCERHRALDGLDLVRGERDFEGFDVRVEVLDLAAADDGEHVRRLLHDIRDGDCKCGDERRDGTGSRAQYRLPAWMLFVPTSLAMPSRTAETLRSSSFRSQSSEIIMRPNQSVG